MVEREIFYSILLIVGGVFLVIYAGLYLRKGQIKFPSVWHKKPISFKKNPTLATMLSLVELGVGLFFILFGVIILIYFNGT